MTPKALYQLAIAAAVIGAVVVGVVLYQRGKTPGTEVVASRTEAPGGTAPAATETAKQPTADSPAPAADGREQAKAPADAGSQAVQQPQTGTEPAPSQAGSPTTPTFDLVRVEPSGETVVAGRSEAGAIVALLSDGKVVGKGVANENGEFAIVLDEPLPPGAHDVTIEASDGTGARKVASEESVAVSVPETKGEEVIVLLSKPGAASEVLQRPQAVAEAPSAPEAKSESAPTATAEAGAVAQAPGEAGKPAAEQTLAAAPTSETPTPAAPTSETPAPAAPETAIALAEPKAEDTAPTETRPEMQALPSADGTAGTKPAEQAVAATEKPAADAEGQALAPEASATEPAEDEAPATVTVDAVEAENDKLFVAGAGKPNSNVRVYVDNQLVGSAKTGPDGRWLLEADKKIEAGEVEVRADQVGDEQGKVVARSQVTFEHAENEVVLRPVSVFGTGSGSLGAGASADGRPIANIIIRRGDNLWRISRRLYGKGIRYTTIYRANDSQIRDPDLIYPGQVFMLPERDVSWSEPAN